MGISKLWGKGQRPNRHHIGYKKLRELQAIHEVANVNIEISSEEGKIYGYLSPISFFQNNVPSYHYNTVNFLRFLVPTTKHDKKNSPIRQRTDSYSKRNCVPLHCGLGDNCYYISSVCDGKGKVFPLTLQVIT